MIIDVKIRVGIEETNNHLLESQIKFFICLESKAVSWTPCTVFFNNACRQEETEVNQIESKQHNSMVELEKSGME